MRKVDPVPRFELGFARWQRAVLPLDDTGMHSAEESNPTHRFWKPGPGHWTSTVKMPLGDLRCHCAAPVQPVTWIPCSEKATEAVARE